MEHYILVSIIIPVYNSEDYIEECLLSVLNQTFRHFEIIIVDDCSQDNSMVLIEKILRGSNIEHVILKQLRNQGQSVARNRGVSRAKGKYLFFLDSDDYLIPNCIEKLWNVAESSASEMTFGNYRILLNGAIQKGFRERPVNCIPRGTMVDTYFSGDTSTAPWNRLILRQWYLSTEVEFPEGFIHEDEPWSFSLALRCSKYSFVNDITYIVRQGPHSTTRNPENVKRRCAGHVIRVRESYREISKMGKQLPEMFFLWHNQIIRDSLYIIAQLLPDNYSSYMSDIVSYAWVPSFSKIWKLPFPELRLFYCFRLLLSNKTAYLLSCKCMAFQHRIGTIFRRTISKLEPFFRHLGS